MGSSYNMPDFKPNIFFPKEFYQDYYKKELLYELNKGEAEINNKINNTFKLENNYIKYGLLNYKWFEIFKLYLNNPCSLDRKQIEELFDFNNLLPKNDEKDYSYINDRYRFSFPSNFVIVTKKFMSLISKYFDYEEQERIKHNVFEMVFGNNCSIFKNKNGKGPYRYITLYEDNKQKISNNIDYILIINEEWKIEEEINYILKHNIWNYLQKISFGDDEYTEISDKKNNITGYCFHNGELERIKKLKNLEKKNIKYKTTIDSLKNNKFLVNQNISILNPKNNNIINIIKHIIH